MNHQKRLLIQVLGRFKDNDFDSSAILTQEMCDKINFILPRELILQGKANISIFANTPVSSQSKNYKKRFIQNIRNGLGTKYDQKFKEICQGKELRVDLIFFLVKDYKTRDLDNLIKPTLDALTSHWFKDDSQIKIINAEKFSITKDINKNVNPKFYEQIYCCVSIID